MPLLLHAIGPAEAHTAAVPHTGLRAEWPVRAVRASGFVAWVSECPDGPRLSRDDLLGHHRLAEQGLAVGVCLPARFPTLVADEHALGALLERQHDGLLAALQRVRGRVELAVTVTWTGEALAAGAETEAETETEAPSGAATTPGRRFLEERQRRYVAADRRRAEARRLARLLEADAHVVEAKHSLCPSDEIGLSSALLVGADAAWGVRKRLQALQGGVRILVSGPWPPYSFVSLEG